MARRNQNTRKATIRKMMGEFLIDINKLGYEPYDYQKKETDNSRNEHSQKTMYTRYGDMEVDIPQDEKGNNP